jgi:UDP-N-acetylglucosamine--N-acetylmuramyl-(pentapeptide) pyrophosphoryl-undecaprenol N-acetylglucosamine transferase
MRTDKNKLIIQYIYSVKPIRLIVSGGGTGGHIYPALAIATELKNKISGSEVLFVGALGKMEMEKVPKAGYQIKGVWISGFQRSLSLQNILFPLKLIVSLFQAFFIIKQFKPTIVVGTGGFASGPVLQVAQWLGLPTLIQEQNSYPGITNRLLSKKVDSICVAFEGMDRFFPLHKIKMTGNPIRSMDLNVNSSKDAKQFFGLDKNKKTLAIIGGSLGAKKINELIASKIEFIKHLDLQILWQCGELYYEEFKNKAQESVVIQPFVYDMNQFYNAADFIISRAGAGSLSELCSVGKPLILIPSPNVTANHQFHNADALARKGAAMVIKENELPAQFETVFTSLVTDNEAQAKMSLALKSLAKTDASKAIVNEMIALL